jgi:hypothetical protein
MQRAALDATAISAKVDDVIPPKNTKINEVDVERARVKRAHIDILTMYEQKMTKFGIPKDEIGCQTGTAPVEFSTIHRTRTEPYNRKYVLYRLY